MLVSAPSDGAPTHLRVRACVCVKRILLMGKVKVKVSLREQLVAAREEVAVER